MAITTVDIKEAVMARKTYTIKIMVALALIFIAGAVLLAEKPWAALDTKKDAPAKDASAKEAESKSPWITRCDDIKDGEKVTGQYCEMVQSISVTKKDADPSTAQRLLEIAIGYPPVAEGKASGVMVLPLGILVTKPVILEIDGSKEKDVLVRYCEVGGCFSSFDLSEKEMGKLAKGKVLVVKAIAATGQPVMIELSLGGFAELYDKIKPKKTGGFFD